MNTIAIDYGLSSPCVCINTDEIHFHFVFFAQRKREIGFKKTIKSNGATYQFTALTYPTFTQREDRYEKVASLLIPFILGATKKDHRVLIENYAFGVTKSRSVSGLYETGAIIRHLLFKNKLSFEEISPSAIKKSATGKGNANKVAMNIFFERETGIDLHKLFQLKRTNIIKKPAEDISDSMYLSLYYQRQALNKDDKNTLKKSLASGLLKKLLTK